MWWTIFTVVLTFAIAALVFWVVKENKSVRWYEWLIGAVGVILLVLCLQNTFGAMLEGESHASITFLWTLGIPALILIALPVILAVRRNTGEA